MKFKSIERFDGKQIAAGCSEFDPEFNKYKTETAGFIPLEVKMKQFEQNGMIAQFQVSEFTSTDYRNMYLNPDYDITPEDDLEDVQEKLEGLRNFQEEYKKSKMNVQNEPAEMVEPTEKNPPTADKEE